MAENIQLCTSGLSAMSRSPDNRPGDSFVFCSVAVAGKLEPLPSQLCRKAREVTIKMGIREGKETFLL